MGCKLSSFAFALTVQDPYLSVQEFLDRTVNRESEVADSSFIEAATDDVLVLIKADPSNPKQLYSRVRGACVTLDLHAEEVGLSFKNEKAHLLLPKGWMHPAPAEDLPDLDVYCDTSDLVERQGIEIWGRP